MPKVRWQFLGDDGAGLVIPAVCRTSLLFLRFCERYEAEHEILYLGLYAVYRFARIEQLIQYTVDGRIHWI